MTEIIIAILASGAFFTFLQFLITRYDTKKGIEKRLDSLDERLDRDKAIEARNHILRFADELRNGQTHSIDYFKQILIDIDLYEDYCEAHPTFSNGLTVMASELIKEEFRKIYRGENNDK
jgi:hypothetical protein